MDQYKSPDWKKFRCDIIESDGKKCVRCGKGHTLGAILQVHHKSYLPGRKPWEYPHELCETLCKGCHAEEHGIICPTSDWEYLATDDLGDLVGACEYCETEIRHVYLIAHPKWHPLEVGTNCCDKLTGTKIASEHRRKFERKRKRQQTFLASPRWKIDPSGSTIEKHGATISVSRAGKNFKISVGASLGKNEFKSEKEAKVAIFEALEDGRFISYLMKKGKSTHPPSAPR